MVQKSIEISGIKITVIYKNIKRVNLSVLPPVGNVKMSVPLNTTDEKIHGFVACNLSKIRKWIKDFKNQARESKRELVNGESHYFAGRRYLLRIIESKNNYVEIARKTYLDIHVTDINNEELKTKTLDAWYRVQLTEFLNELIEKWSIVLNITKPNFSIRKMKTKWASVRSSITFNLDLSKKDYKCIEYMVLNMLSEKRQDIMDRYMPTWQSINKELNQSMLSHEDWA